MLCCIARTKKTLRTDLVNLLQYQQRTHWHLNNGPAYAINEAQQNISARQNAVIIFPRLNKLPRQEPWTIGSAILTSSP